MKKNAIILLHFSYWFLYSLFILLMIVLFNGSGKVNSTVSKYQIIWQFGLLTILPAICAFYSYYYLLFNHFLSKRKILWLFIIGFILALLSSLFSAIVLHISSLFGHGFTPFDEGIYKLLGTVIILAIIALLNGGMGLLLKGFIRWYADIKLKEDLMKKNFDTELALVKSQLDPHFLFNTLNNIDVLMLKDKELASKYLNKLCEIMRFMLYETKGSHIPLSKELEYIEKYVDLQKIRTANKDFVSLKIEGNPDGAEIIPMLFIPFVENAFKHGERIRMGNAVSILIKIENSNLLFECQNRFNKIEVIEEKEGGLGNDLIVKRLELLYPKKHDLKIVVEENNYKVILNVYL